MKKIPRTTLFMITSLDGKISSGDTDVLDVDKDWKGITGVKEGLQQYYDLEKRTDVCSFNTGRVMAKIGINKKKNPLSLIPVSFILVDNKPHLQKSGVEYLSKWLKHVYIVTTNKNHPAISLQKNVKNITVLLYSKKINFQDLFERLKMEFKINRVTIQSGGEMNATLLRAGLIDRVSLVLAPILVGGRTTPTLVDGESLHKVSELAKLRPLRLVSIKKLKNSYIHLIYKVLERGK
ncbi:MAG: deaminase [Candidatus Magasanikbacteria bacterium CG11_big_fil_rev_8_21_14_0_20_39_34]|uniref:Deaminase n=1 Tax=Candidatus Magasanikbacteria bacterium CG11_big_fil_rev_8_21_14_0_20_39_34 TaxID=1974653 RepID=A0A2H0N3V7_9BACT|nr:MAG: deaminase [Candidatus Magasanikbacteria bacterium CG11_big_fil_rev_8_21_14_0_20_39_34]